jgi:REP element-mobilizing transposase RayT
MTIFIFRLKAIFPFMFQAPSGYNIINPTGLYFVTCTIVDWVDVFSRCSYRDILIDNLNFYHRQRGLQIYGYVVMTNHMHALLRQPEGSLSDTLRDFKKMTARTILETMKTEPESRREWILHRFEWNAGKRQNRGFHQVWTADNHPIEIWSRAFFDQKLNYIHMNPVRAGWVSQAEYWRYSSASDMLTTAPLVPLTLWND